MDLDAGPLNEIYSIAEAEALAISDREIVDLITAYRLYGYFRADLNTGHLYFSEHACRVHGLPVTDKPLNIAECLKMTHPDDVKLVTGVGQELGRGKDAAHFIYRFQDGKGGYKYIRRVCKFRENGTPAGEIVGVVYEFYERFSTLVVVD
jgi:hypothetical protein